MQNTYQVQTIFPILEKQSKYAAKPSNSPANGEMNKLNEKHPLTVSVPGSKSITNRALLLATLASGDSTLRGVLFSDDSRHFLSSVKDLGFDLSVDEAGCVVQVKGLGGRIPKSEASIYVGSAGTAARFLAAALGISNGTYDLDASEQMRKRPMAPLLSALQELGCEITYPADGKEGFFPFTLRSKGFGLNQITININESSQFLSALLIASVLSPEDFTTQVEGTHGMAYIRMTLAMMKQFGVETQKLSESVFCTPAGQHYTGLDYRIEPDASAAAYFYAMCPLLGIPVKVSHIHFASLQGDVRFIRILEEMGCHAVEEEDGIVLLPPADGKIKGIDVNMSDCSDQAITLAAIAPFAEGPTTIRGIGHIRLQESDRLTAIETELTKMGIQCESGQDWITIHPGNPAPSEVATYDDHRMAMGFSLIGLRAEGITILDPGCCRKTFENYFQVLDQVIADLRDFS